jgi:hypothetical protein
MLVLAMEFSRDLARAPERPMPKAKAGGAAPNATVGPLLPGQSASKRNGRCRRERITALPQNGTEEVRLQVPTSSGDKSTTGMCCSRKPTNQ